MKPQKLKILKNFLANDERAWTDPLSRVILEGMVRLIEWDTKMMEVFPSIEPEISEYYLTVSKAFVPGYFCSFSENYMIEDEAAAKPFEASEDEQVRNVLDLAFLASCGYIRDLADLYRTREDVRKLVDSCLEAAASDAKEKRSWKNILNRTHFLNDGQIEKMRIQIVHSIEEASKQVQ